MRNFKKCYITGITGAGGSYLAEYIFRKNKKIKIIGTYRTKGYLQLLKKNIKKIKTNKLDLRDFKKTKNFLKKNKPDLIYHFASVADVRKSFDYPYEIISNNNIITLNLLEAIRVTKIKPIIAYFCQDFEAICEISLIVDCYYCCPHNIDQKCYLLQSYILYFQTNDTR